MLARLCFLIRRSDFPHVTVRADFKDEGAIELRFAYRRSDNADTVRWEDRITFRPADEFDRPSSSIRVKIDATEACNNVCSASHGPEIQAPSK